MRFDSQLAEEQSQAARLAGVLQAHFHLPKFFKNEAVVLGINARSLVANGNPDPVRRADGSQPDRAVVRGEFYGVTHEILDDAFDQSRITKDQHLGRWRFHQQLAAFLEGRQGVEGFCNELIQVRGDEPEFEFARFHFAEVEQRTNHVGDGLGGGRHVAEDFAALWSDGFNVQQLQPQHDSRQWRPHIMHHQVNEFVAQGLQFLEPGIAGLLATRVSAGAAPDGSPPAPRPLQTGTVW